MINFITTRLVQLSTYVLLWYVTALSSDIFWCHNVISIVRLHLGVHCHFSLVSCSHQPYQLFGGPTHILYQGRWIQSYGSKFLSNFLSLSIYQRNIYCYYASVETFLQSHHPLTSNFFSLS